MGRCVACDKCTQTSIGNLNVKFLIVADINGHRLFFPTLCYPCHPSPPLHTHSSDVASVLSIHGPPFAFCHQDRMRRHLNPLPVTKATDHHCNQIPATFQCFLQQWDKVLFFHLNPTPSDHAVCALLNLNTTGAQYITHQCFKECYCILLYFVEGNYICRRVMGLNVQLSAK